MLALVVSALAGLYLLGPGLVFRLAVGLVVPRKTITETQSELITRSVFQAVPITLLCGWFAARQGVLHVTASDFANTFSGLTSSTFYDAHLPAVLRSSGALLAANLQILWRLYLVVSLVALLEILAIREFRWLYSFSTRYAPRLRPLLSIFVLPRVSEWHVLLSDMLVPRGSVLFADILTRSGLYSGQVEDKILTAEGGLETITLARPRRFRKEAFDAAEAARPAGTSVDPAGFWTDIPGNLYILLASDIVNLNLRYIVRNEPADRGTAGVKLSPADVAVLREVLDRLNRKAPGPAVQVRAAKNH